MGLFKFIIISVLLLFLSGVGFAELTEPDWCKDGRFCDADRRTCFTCPVTCGCNEAYETPCRPPDEDNNLSYHCDRTDLPINVVKNTPACGDGFCYADDGENENTCPADCPKTMPKKDPCGDGVCSLTDGENGKTCPADCFEICGNGIDDDNNGLVDCADTQVCGTDPFCSQDLSIRVVDGVYGKPMKYIPVAITVKDKSKSNDMLGYTDTTGIVKFKIDMAQYESPVMAYAALALKDKDGIIKVVYDNDADPIVVETKVFILPWGKEPLELAISEDSSFIDTKASDSRYVSNLADLSLIYYNTMEAVDFFRNDLGHEYDATKLPVTIHAFSSAGICTACYSPRQKAIYFDKQESLRTSINAPENREWHEFSHHVMVDVYGNMPALATGDKNHGGFSNSETEDSFSEAFAEFWPSVMGNDDLYSGFYNLKSGTRAWDNYGSSEELAFLSTMWDVKGEMTNGYKDLWTLVKSNKPQDVKQFYSAVTDIYPSDKTVIDAIFIKHGFFKDGNPGNGKRDLGEVCWDTNKNKVCDAGDKFIDLSVPNTTTSKERASMHYDPGTEDSVGTATNSARWQRTSRPLFWFNSIALDVKDASGKKITDAAFDITYDYSGKCEGSGFTYPVQMRDGNINLLFPEDLDTCTIKAKIAPRNYAKVEELTISKSDFDSAVGDKVTADNMLEPGTAFQKSITIGQSINVCDMDLKCEPGENMCSDCAYSGPQYECASDVDCGESSICYGGKCTAYGNTCDLNGVCDSGEGKNCADCKTAQGSGNTQNNGKTSSGDGSNGEGSSTGPCASAFIMPAIFLLAAGFAKAKYI